MPLTPTRLAADAAACVRAGAAAIHVHPRAASGHETLGPAAIDETVTLIRAAIGVPVGVSTGAWIEPDPTRRAERVSSWRAPDVASVDFTLRMPDGAIAVSNPALVAAAARAGAAGPRCSPRR